MKNILIMSFGSDAGGIEKSLVNFIKHITVRYNVDLYLWRSPGILFNELKKNAKIINQKLVPGNLKHAIRFVFPFGILWYLVFRLLRLFKKEILAFRKIQKSYDVAISYCQNGYSPYYIIDKVIATKKILWYHHGSYEQTGKRKEIDLSYYTKYDVIVTVSESNKAMLLKHFPELKNKIQVVKNIIDPSSILQKSDEFINYRKRTGICNIVTVGRIAPEKGQILALAVAKELKSRSFPFHWIFVGDGPDMKTCQELLIEYQIEDNCEFIGVQDNPYPYIKFADVYVQTSSIEADPITIAEAKLLHKLIVASDIPPIRESLNNEKFGLLSNLTYNDFADTIIGIFNNQQKADELYTNLKKVTGDYEQQLSQIYKLLS